MLKFDLWQSRVEYNIAGKFVSIFFSFQWSWDVFKLLLDVLEKF